MGCCCGSDQTQPKTAGVCPLCGSPGWSVDIITLKSLLRPHALEQLLPQSSYAFCSSPDCDIVYFTNQGSFKTKDLKVPVFQKDRGAEVPVCYCFGWTRKRVADEVAVTGISTAVAQVTEHTKAGRCGCDVNNPQGGCCLGNLRSFVQHLEKC